MDLQAILLLMAVVMAMGAVAAAIGRFVVRAEPSALVPLALAAGCAVSFIQQDGWPALAKSGGVLALSPMWASIVVVAAALSLVALADGLLPRRWIAIRGRRWRVAIAAAGVVGAFLRLPAVEWIGLSYVAAIATAVLVIATDELVSRQRGVAWIATLSIAFVATGALFVQSGFAKGGVIAGALGATLLAVALVSWCTRVGLGSIASACVLALLASFTALGLTYADDDYPLFPSWLWLVPTVAPLAAWIGEVPIVAQRPRVAALVRCGIPLALCVGAVGFSFRTAPSLVWP